MVLLEKASDILNQPFKVLAMCLLVGFTYLMYDGSFWNLWSLHRNHKEMQKRIELIKEDTKSLNFRVEEARSQPFIERQATEQLGLVREDDLVIVFSEGD
jgi:cell division protein FtsB